MAIGSLGVHTVSRGYRPDRLTATSFGTKWTFRRFAGGGTVLEQTSLSAQTQFEFGENHLGYSFDGDRKHRQFKVDYAELPKRTGFTLSTSAWLRRTGFLACSIGVLHAGWAATSGASMLAGTILGGVGVFNLILHALSRKGFTVLKTEQGEIRIIRDRRHDQILRELRTRRRARILELHGPRVIPRALLGPGSPRAPTGEA